jgi:hypothetical protein
MDLAYQRSPERLVNDPLRVRALLTDGWINPDRRSDGHYSHPSLDSRRDLLTLIDRFRNGNRIRAYLQIHSTRLIDRITTDLRIDSEDFLLQAPQGRRQNDRLQELTHLQSCSSLKA